MSTLRKRPRRFHIGERVHLVRFQLSSSCPTHSPAPQKEYPLLNLSIPPTPKGIKRICVPTSKGKNSLVEQQGKKDPVTDTQERPSQKNSRPNAFKENNKNTNEPSQSIQ